MAARERLEVLCARDDGHVGSFGRTIALLQTANAKMSKPIPVKRAAVLYHGLTLSPMQFKDIAVELHARGYNVIVPRLPRHGHANRLSTSVARLSVDELKKFTAETLAIARGLGKHVTVVGFSLGGLLAGWIAQHEPVECAVMISPSLGSAILSGLWNRQVASAVLRLPNFFQWLDPLKRERRMPEYTYPRYSTHAVANAYLFANELFEEARASAPRAGHITLIGNNHDVTVSNRAIAKLVELWRAKRRDGIEAHFLQGLPISHDIIDPLRRPWAAERVYPTLLRLLDP